MALERVYVVEKRASGLLESGQNVCAEELGRGNATGEHKVAQTLAEAGAYIEEPARTR